VLTDDKIPLSEDEIREKLIELNKPLEIIGETLRDSYNRLLDA
jgi:hypothetical protein